jgi:hypothetical protein
MNREKNLPDGTTQKVRLDDVTPPPNSHGTGLPPTPGDGFMETWDVVEAPHPTRAAPLPKDDDDEW